MALFLIGCNRRTAALPEAAPPAIEVAETVAIDEHTIPQEPETQPVYGNSAGELSPVREVSPYELRNVMPNSWRKLTGLTVAERKAFIQENNAAFSEIERSMRNYFRDNRIWNYFVFRQQVGTDTFYRFLVTENSSPDFLSRDIWFYQFLIYQNKILTSAEYNSLMHTQSDTIRQFRSIDIIYGKGSARGILVTELSSSNTLRNGQLFGGNRSTYFLMPEGRSLVDPDAPLRYSLQNAFDGNPETAFIANTVDGLIRFEVMLFNFEKNSTILKRFSFINGYTLSPELFSLYNRARSIVAWVSNPFTRQEILLADTKLPQIVDSKLPEGTTTFRMQIETVYNGSRYNKTALAEMNIEFYPFGWLFGEIDE